MSVRARGFLAGLVAVAIAACAPRASRSPEAVRDAYLAAVRADDPAAAYALLALDVRARVDYPSFLARWKADDAERRDTLDSAARLPRKDIVASHAATTVHDGGLVLRWAHTGDRWLLTGGLPPAARTSTPAEAIRGFIAALGSTPLGDAQQFLAPELADGLREDWASRAEAVEAALARPGALELSDDLQRAQLRYAPQRVIVLEQTPRGWAIVSLE